MSQHFRDDRRPAYRGIDDHDDRYCGHSWESSCRSCRIDYWPDRYFAMATEARPFLPRLPVPFLSQRQLIRTMHYYRNKAEVRAAMMELLADEIIELVDERIKAWRMEK